MSTCNYGQAVCAWGHCPRCPECTCRGARRGRARPKNFQKRTTAASASKAWRLLRQNMREDACDPVEPKGINSNPGSSTTLCHDPISLLSTRGLSKYSTRYLPTSERRHTTFADLTLKDPRSLQDLMKKCFLAVTSILLPNDSRTLHTSFKDDNVNAS